MALIACPDCGKKVSDRARHCMKCGCPIVVDVDAPVVVIREKSAPVVWGWPYVSYTTSGGSVSLN